MNENTKNERRREKNPLKVFKILGYVCKRVDRFYRRKKKLFIVDVKKWFSLCGDSIQKKVFFCLLLHYCSVEHKFKIASRSVQHIEKSNNHRL